MATALVIGRFQPFHKGHEFLIKEALKENESIIIAVGSSQESRTKKNPFNYKERKKLIQSCFKDAKIIPVPDYESDDDWVNYLLKFKFEIVYSNNKWVDEIFSKIKFKVKKIKELQNISSTIIRKMIIDNEKSYKKLMPKNCLKVMNDINAERIIKECFKTNK
ncbi:MAG: adenylyltransferase/cytidyltransferase family protein [Candidatus Nanoarchaeia archaeon]|jgi:nicotinamide-nucleotide adenylyltransferase